MSSPSIAPRRDPRVGIRRVGLLLTGLVAGLAAGLPLSAEAMAPQDGNPPQLFSQAAVGAETPRGAPDLRLEVGVRGEWLEARLADGMRVRCPDEAPPGRAEPSRCVTTRFGSSVPVELGPSPTEVLVPGRHLGEGVEFRVGAGWDRMILSNLEQMAQPPMEFPLSGEAGERVRLQAFLFGELGSRWAACLERVEGESVETRACFRVGTVARDWGRAISATLTPWDDAAGVVGFPVASADRGEVEVLHPDDGWIPAPHSSSLSWDGEMTIRGSAFPRDPTQPAMNLDVDALGGEVRLRIPRGWTEFTLRRHHPELAGLMGITALDPESFTARFGRWELNPETGHEVLLQLAVDRAEEWTLCLARGDRDRAYQACHEVRFGPPQEVPAEVQEANGGGR